jgi:hypothetical protein
MVTDFSCTEFKRDQTVSFNRALDLDSEKRVKLGTETVSIGVQMNPYWVEVTAG